MAEIKLQAENLLSIVQAAAVLGISRQAVYLMAGRGELHLIMIGGHQYLDKSEVERLTAERA